MVDYKEVINMCQHYFIIETPNGRMSKGKCKYCGLKRNFHNSLEDDDYKKWTTNSIPQRTRENMIEAILNKKAKGEYVY